MSSEKTKALINKSAGTKDEQNKFAEEATAFGQLVGAGFNYEVFEKEGAPLGEFIRGGAKKVMSAGRSLGSKIMAGGKKVVEGVKPVTTNVHKRIVDLGQKANLKAGLYRPGKAGVKRNIATGYGLGAVAVGAGGAGVIAGKNVLSKKQAEDAEAKKKVADEKKAAEKKVTEKKAAEKTTVEQPVTADNLILRYTNEVEE